MNEAFKQHACNILGDTNTGLTSTEIARYFVDYSVKFKRTIPFTTSRFSVDGNLLTKKDGFRENLNCFSDEEKFYILNQLCSLPKFSGNESVRRLHVMLLESYSNLDTIDAADQKLDLEIITRTNHWLNDYPSALKVYGEAMDKYKLKTGERNVLDDLRLSLELLLKEIFGSERSLEHQLSNVGTLISKAGGSKEFTNMFVKLLDYFSQYQNTYVKHNDKINPNEIEFVMEIASLFMKNIVKFKSISK